MHSSGPAKLVGPVNTGPRARIVIADDHVLVAEACKVLLEPEFEVVGIVPNGRVLLDHIDEFQPDVVILDIAMPLLNGLDAGGRIKVIRPRAKLVYMTVASAPDIAAEAFRRGASGYVLKHGPSEELRIAVRRSLRGESYLSPLVDSYEFAMCLRLGAEYSPEKRLSPRQREILQLLAEGKTLKETAYLLQVKPGTAAFHKYKIMDILGIRTSAGLIDYALRHNIATKLPE